MIEHAIDMMFRAIGLRGANSVTRIVGWLAWGLLRARLAVLGLTAKLSEVLPRAAK